MVRRSKDEAEETRENIIEAAIRLFLRDGVAHTTLEKIATEAGYTRGAVYHHFENKATLLLELLKEVRPPAESMFESVSINEDDDPMGAIREALEKTLKVMLSDKRVRDVHTIFIHNCEFVEKENPIFASECRYGQGMRKIIGKAFTRAQELGQMRRDITPDQASIVLHAFCYGIYSMALKGSWVAFSAEELPATVAIDVFFSGLKAEAQPPQNPAANV